MVENILKVVSRELSAVEVMQVFKGQVTPVARLQTGLFNFVREKLLGGIPPGKGRRDEAVEAFLANVVPSLRPVEVGQCFPGQGTLGWGLPSKCNARPVGVGRSHTEQKKCCVFRATARARGGSYRLLTCNGKGLMSVVTLYRTGYLPSS